MNSIDIRYISTDAEILVLKFGKAIVQENRRDGLRITGGSVSDRGAAQVWIDCITPGSDLKKADRSGLN